MLLSAPDWKGNCQKIQDKGVGSMNVFLQRPRDAVRSLNIPYRAQHWCFLWNQHLPFPRSPLFKGLKVKEPHFGGKGAKHFWKSAPFREIPGGNPQIQIPESLGDGWGIFRSPGYVSPHSCTQPLSREVNTLRGETAGLVSNSPGIGLWETLRCLCFVTIAHGEGTDHLSLPVLSLRSQDIPPRSTIPRNTRSTFSCPGINWPRPVRWGQSPEYHLHGLFFPMTVSQSELE